MIRSFSGWNKQINSRVPMSTPSIKFPLPRAPSYWVIKFISGLRNEGRNFLSLLGNSPYKIVLYSLTICIMSPVKLSNLGVCFAGWRSSRVFTVWLFIFVSKASLRLGLVQGIKNLWWHLTSPWQRPLPHAHPLLPCKSSLSPSCQQILATWGYLYFHFTWVFFKPIKCKRLKPYKCP